MNSENLERTLEKYRGARIAVIGDLMLDEYVWGDVSRISPDAPVQIVEVRRRSRAMGGAANVARNVASAGGTAFIFGVVGDDPAGQSLPALLAEAGVDRSGVVVESGRPTTIKTRVVARGQHIVRLDEEVDDPLQRETRSLLLERLGRVVGDCDAILVSDYAKGVVDERLVADIADLAARRRGSRAPPPIVVDPKAHDFSRYEGCFAVTPNQKESESASRVVIRTDDDLKEAVRRLRASCGAGWVLVTRGAMGMALSGPDGRLEHIPARTREVYDVTGAGDIVMAYFGMGLAAGAEPLEAAWIANVAAGIGVGKVGAAAVGQSEVLSAELGARTAPRKIVQVPEALARLGHERSLGHTIVFTNGCFDLLHAGHVHLLEKAKELGDILIVAVNSDASVRRLKGEGRPLVAEQDRLKVLSGLDAVDLLVVFDEDTPMEVIHRIKPDVLVKGGDYSVESIVGAAFVREYGGRVETISLVSGRSTSGIIATIDRNRSREKGQGEEPGS